jgi:hypothetical protein
MKKAKLVTIAMLLTCVKGYSLSNEDQYQALKRGAYQTIENHKNEILDCDQTKLFVITPLKSNGEDSEKGFTGRLSVVLDMSANVPVYKMIVKLKNLEIFSTTIDSDILKSLKNYESIKFQYLIQNTK